MKLYHGKEKKERGGGGSMSYLTYYSSFKRGRDWSIKKVWSLIITDYLPATIVLGLPYKHSLSLLPLYPHALTSVYSAISGNHPGWGFSCSMPQLSSKL